MRIAVLGGGVAGAVLARELSRTPFFQIDLLEHSPSLGGLHRSVEVGGAWYDIGAFLFDREHALLKTFPSLYDHFVPTGYRGVSVTRHRTLDTYPLSLRGYMRDNGISSFLLDLADLLRCKFTCRNRDSLVAWMHYYLGRGIYSKSGLKSYIERLYAVPDTEVDLEFALQRIPSLPQECGLRRNLHRLLREMFNPKSREDQWGCYVRPAGGFPQAYRLIEAELRGRGIQVRTGSRPARIEKKGREYLIDFEEASSQRYDLIISTIPVGTTMRLIGKPMAYVPETMRLISLCYRFQGEPGLGNANMLFNFTGRGDWKRLNLFSSYYGRMEEDEYFVVECTARSKDARDPDYMRHSFEEHIGTLPILKGDLKFQEAIVTENAYPFFRQADIGYVEEARRTLTDFGIILTGRQGRFVYTDSNVTAAASRQMAAELRKTYG